MSKAIVNTAHPEGLTCLAFSRDGSRAYTGGSDCIVRIWRIDQGGDQEPEIASEAAQAITSLSDAAECWLSGCEDGEVRRYTKHKPDIEGLVTSVNAVAIRCVAPDPNGKRVAVTSEELSLKIVDLDDIKKVTMLQGHKRAVRRATWHPSGTLLATCGADGKIIIWNVSEEEAKEEKVLEGIIPAVHDIESLEYAYDCSALWHPSGQYFFVASRAHELVTISTSTWTKSSTFTDDNVSGPITSLAVSPNGVYLASSSRSTVYIWSTQTRRLLYQHSGEPDSPITQLSFSPSQNLLAWVDYSGALTRWPQPIPASAPDPIKRPLSSVALTAQVKRPGSPSLFGDSGKAVEHIDQDNGLGLAEDGDDWIIDDLGILGENEGGRDNQEFVKEMVSITKAQPAFQPGSTPMENKKRYLAFNMVGVIEITDQDTHHIVNVEFHDQSARKGYHFTDHFKYDLGYLGERGAVFSCQSENGHPAQVVYKPYASWTSQSEWTYSIPPSASSSLKILSVAAGGMPPADSLRRNADDDLQGFGDVVVATSDGDLTFLSGTGRERRIMGLGSDVVSMIAGAEWVFVVHRTGSTTIDGSQNLSYSMINFEDFTVRQRDVLPIPKGHTLIWIGISAEGAPAMYDSTGRIHVLTKFRIPHHASWARILDTNLLERREGKDESYWPVGVAGDKFMCLILKGRQEYPGFPRPLIQELPVRMPFRRTDQKELEEHIARETLFLELVRDSLGETLTTDEIAQREINMDKEFIQLIQAACKAGNIPRAIELTKLLHHAASVNMAIKVAEFYQLFGLREKMEMLKARKEEDEDRLELARRKRRQWLQADPLPRRLPDAASSSSRPDPLQDTRTPPPVYRPGLARAIPTIQPTRFPESDSLNDVSRSASIAPTEPVEPSPEPNTLDGKRKRGDNDGVFSQDDDDSSKRRAVEAVTIPPLKTKQNPFAKKPENGRNPFARKSDNDTTIKKSESFFDKVDAVQTNKSKAKGTKGRQTTLFGLPAVQTSDKKGKAKMQDESKSPMSSVVVIEDNAASQSTSSMIVESQFTLDSRATQADGGEPLIEWAPSPQSAQEERDEPIAAT